MLRNRYAFPFRVPLATKVRSEPRTTADRVCQTTVAVPGEGALGGRDGRACRRAELGVVADRREHADRQLGLALRNGQPPSHQPHPPGAGRRAGQEPVEQPRRLAAQINFDQRGAVSRHHVRVHRRQRQRLLGDTQRQDRVLLPARGCRADERQRGGAHGLGVRRVELAQGRKELVAGAARGELVDALGRRQGEQEGRQDG